MSIDRIARELSRGPYSWEYIPERPEGQRYRIRDSRDDALGSAATEAEANQMVRQLNGGDHADAALQSLFRLRDEFVRTDDNHAACRIDEAMETVEAVIREMKR